MRSKWFVGSSLVISVLVSTSATPPRLDTPDEQATFTMRGAELVLAGHIVGLRVASVDRDGAALRLEAETPRREGNHVRWARGAGIEEWWRRDGDDLEHGVTLTERPSGDGPLAITLGLEGAEPIALGDRAIALRAESGEIVATYGGLTVIDADGREVPAGLAVIDGVARIDVEDEGARYPLVVDPLVTAQEAFLAGAVTQQGPKALAISRDGLRLVAGPRVYLRTGTAWALETTLTAAGSSSILGTAAAISADGSRIALGDPGYNVPAVGAGRVVVYSRAGTLWTMETTFVDPATPAMNDSFGIAVAMSADGTRIAVGCPTDDAFVMDGGGVFVFRRSAAGAWTTESVPRPTDLDVTDQVGRSVALSADGTRLATGSIYDGGTSAGTVRVYTRTGTSWAFDTTIPRPDLSTYNFGHDVALDANGSHLLVGSRNPASPSPGAFAYDRSATGAWTRNASLSLPTAPSGNRSVSISDDGTRAVVGATTQFSETGTAYAFRRSGATWTRDTTIVPTGLATGSQFGSPIAISGDGSRATANGQDGVRVFTIRDGNGGPCTTTDACTSGFCVDGVCCDAACTGTCEACATSAGGTTNGTCTALNTMTAATTTCRAMADACDVAEACSTSSRNCPTDGFTPSGTECRPVHGTCDVREVCTGSSAACPPDLAASVGTTCHAAMGSCDVEEQCDGAAFDCPPDGFRASGAMCDATINGPCDLPDTCDGTSAACPPRFRPPHSSCGAAPSGVCDAPDECTGASAECLPSFVTGVECRASIGACDTAEVCSGTAADCPPDGVEAAGMVCRASTNAACDPSESCDGVAATCPADVTTCTATDAGAADAGATPDGGIRSDASTPGGDAGTTTPPAVGSCACRLGAHDPRTPVTGALVMLVLGLRRGRRARSRR